MPTATRWSPTSRNCSKTGDGVLWLTDRKGRRVGVPVVKVAYVEVGAPAGDRRVGFGAP